MSAGRAAAAAGAGGGGPSRSAAAPPARGGEPTRHLLRSVGNGGAAPRSGGVLTVAADRADEGQTVLGCIQGAPCTGQGEKKNTMEGLRVTKVEDTSAVLEAWRDFLFV